MPRLKLRVAFNDTVPHLKSISMILCPAQHFNDIVPRLETCEMTSPSDTPERLVVYCRTTSANTTPCTFRRICCPTHCSSYSATPGIVRNAIIREELVIRLPGKENSYSHCARLVHQIISMIKWIRTSRFLIKNTLSLTGIAQCHACKCPS